MLKLIEDWQRNVKIHANPSNSLQTHKDQWFFHEMCATIMTYT